MPPDAVTTGLRRKPPVPQSEYVSVSDLAVSLGIDSERLRPLIEKHYLTILEPHEYLQDCLVARPRPAALAWLKTMFQPLMMRPLLPTEMAAELLDMTVNDFRRLCLAYNAPLHDDPGFGELMTLSDFWTVFRRVHASRSTCRFDRQAMLMLTRVLRPQTISRFRADQPVLPYSVILERELERIAQMPEPTRTVRAVALYNAYQDARTVKDCIAKYKQATIEPEATHKGVGFETRLNRLMEQCVGKLDDAVQQIPRDGAEVTD